MTVSIGWSIFLFIYTLCDKSNGWHLICPLLYCSNKCRTSIVDFHRSCKHCFYDLCLNCCKELRKGEIPGGEEVEALYCESRDRSYAFGKILQSKDANKSVPSRRHNNSSNGEPHNGMAAVEKLNNHLHLWKAKIDGSIPCPPKEIGGCMVLKASPRRRLGDA